MNVHVLPSAGESFGLPCLEAAACGIPNIVTKCTNMPYLVKDTGLVVDTRGEVDTQMGRVYLIDEYKLSRAMELLYKDREYLEELSVKARKRAKLFSWSKIIKLLHTYLHDEIT